MKHKRLQHHADTLCHMFCGWQLLHGYKVITELEKGVLEIDALNGECFHDGTHIKALSIASVLNSWLNEDLETNNIPVSFIKKALLTIDFQTEKHVGQRDKSTKWACPTKEFISCYLDCASIIETDEKEYIGKYSETEEWPTNYGN